MRLGRRAFIGLGATTVVGAAAAVLGRDRFFGGDELPPAVGPRIVPTPFSGNTAARQDWDTLVKEAKGEGTLFILVRGGIGYRRATSEFQTAFPGIDVQVFTDANPTSWLERLRSERKAGKYTLDLAFVQAEAAITQGLKDGLWAPLRPLVGRSDVIDDKMWRDGFAARFLDTKGQFAFGWEYQVQHAYAVDSRVVKDGEIQSVRDLLDPKWRGKVITSDPRIGSGLLSASAVAKKHGNDVVKALLVEQQPKIASSMTELTDGLVKGSHPIAQGVRPRGLIPYRDRGEAAHIRFLDLPDADHVPGTALFAFNNTPHPAAARLFVNWVLTKEGQTALAGNLLTNSARWDVSAFEKDGVGRLDAAYYEPDREAHYSHTAATLTYVKGLLG
ncbi:MAG: extracellular solute-binding protein [Dehalococcoidia bacterium]|nr:MAG: extracellular solute-binding protein [Dehalococcoidia bacterium]